MTKEICVLVKTPTTRSNKKRDLKEEKHLLVVGGGEKMSGPALCDQNSTIHLC